jgi:hypothetical protein
MVTDETPVPATATKKRSIASIPAADQNKKDVSQTVVVKWKLNPGITLLWTTAAEFENTVKQFADSLDKRLTTGGGRASVTNELKVLDSIINKHADYLKGYLKDKFDKENAPAYYPQFGIVKQGESSSFPKDRNKRQAALVLTVKAMAAHEFEDKKFGLAFWKDISDRYTATLQLSVNTDSSVANLVSAKNEARKQIQKTLNALIHIIKGNYPDTYASVLREWGFQKEKY